VLSFEVHKLKGTQDTWV